MQFRMALEMITPSNGSVRMVVAVAAVWIVKVNAAGGDGDVVVWLVADENRWCW